MKKKTKKKEEQAKKEGQARKACGLYLRVSTDMQASVKDGSLDTQLSTLTKYVEIKTANTDEEWTVAEVYREEGRSGKNADRPAYQRMLSDIKAGKLDVVLCTKIDRVHRSLVDFYRLHELMEKHNVDFVSLSENWDTSTPMGRFGLKLTLAVAELEREQTSLRTKDKMRWRAEEGLWNGGQVLGYDIDPEDKGVLKANEAETRVVREVFEVYRETRSLRETTRRMNGKGYRSKAYQSRRGHSRGGGKFVKTTITYILTNPVYIGKVTHNGDVFEGKHEGIVDEPVWHEVNRYIQRNRKLKKKPRKQKGHCFLLEGLVRCGSCGVYMTPTYATGRKRRRYFYYQCTSHSNGRDECETKRVSAAALENLVAERLLEMARNEDLVKSILAETQAGIAEETKIIQERRRLQEKALAPVEQEIRNLVRFVAQGKGTPALAEELEKLEIQKQQLREEMEKIDLEAREFENRTLSSQLVQEGLGLFTEIWEAAEPAERKELMRLFVHRLIYAPTEVKLGLHTWPMREVTTIKAEMVNHSGSGSVNRTDWLPG